MPEKALIERRVEDEGRNWHMARTTPYAGWFAGLGTG